MSFDLAGEYVLMLKAADGIHTPSYATLRVRVSDGISVSVRRDGNSLRVEWSGGAGNYTLESTDDLRNAWTIAATLTGTEYFVPQQSGQRFFRVRRE